MLICTVEKMEEHIKKVMEGVKRKDDTLEVQICLKGYDLKKDAKFDKNVVLPYKKRTNEKILVVGDKALEEAATEANLPFVSFDAVTGKTKERQSLKKKIASKNHAIITTGLFHKHFEILYLNRKRTPFYLMKPQTDLKKFYEEVTRTVKFKLRQTNCLSFPAGTMDMPSNEIAQNVHTGITFLTTLLKKGKQNIDSIFIKSTQSAPIALN